MFCRWTSPGGVAARTGLWHWDDVLATAARLAARRGVREAASPALLQRLREHGQIDWGRAKIDGASVSSHRAETDPNLIDQGKLGNKRHGVVDARGVLLAIMAAVVGRRTGRNQPLPSHLTNYRSAGLRRRDWPSSVRGHSHNGTQA